MTFTKWKKRQRRRDETHLGTGLNDLKALGVDNPPEWAKARTRIAHIPCAMQAPFDLASYARATAALASHLKLTTPEVHALPVGATVLVGGIGGVQDIPRQRVSADKFLVGLDANGARGAFDGVSYHPYSTPYRPSQDSWVGATCRFTYRGDAGNPQSDRSGRVSAVKSGTYHALWPIAQGSRSARRYDWIHPERGRHRSGGSGPWAWTARRDRCDALAYPMFLQCLPARPRNVRRTEYQCA